MNDDLRRNDGLAMGDFGCGDNLDDLVALVGVQDDHRVVCEESSNLVDEQERLALTAEIMADLKEKRANGDISEEQYEEMVRKIFGES